MIFSIRETAFYADIMSVAISTYIVVSAPSRQFDIRVAVITCSTSGEKVKIWVFVCTRRQRFLLQLSYLFIKCEQLLSVILPM